MKRFFQIIAAFFLLFVCLPVAAKPKTVAQKSQAAVAVEEQRKLDYYFYDALRQRHLGNYDRAIDLLTECFFINPKNAAVAYEFATIYSHFQDTKHALSFMELAARLDPANVWYKTACAEMYVKNNDLNKAIALYEEIAKTTADEDMDFMLASLYKQTAKPQKSIDALNRYEEKVGMDKEISMEKFELYMQMNKKKKAYKEVDKLVKKFPSNANYKLWRGSLYMEDKQPAKALLLYEEARKAEPSNAVVAMKLFEYYLAAGDTIQANRVYADLYANKDISLENKLYALDLSFVNTTQSSAAMDRHLQTLIAQYPDNETLLSYYANVLLIQRRNAEAKAILEQQLQINRQNKDAWKDLLSLYALEDNWNSIRSTAEKAIEAFPDEAPFYLFKASAQLKNKDYEGALETYKAGAAKVPPNNTEAQAEFLMYVGDSYAAQNKIADALDYYEKACTLNANNILLLNNYAYYLSLAKKDLDKAEAMSARTVGADPNNVSFLDTYAWIFFVKGNLTLAGLYIKQAIDKGGDENDVVCEHYGDILFLSGDADEALTWWRRAAEKGNKSEVLKRKIERKSYIEE